MQKQFSLYFTCAAVVEGVNQNDEQESNTYDPGHDGSVFRSVHDKVLDQSTGNEQLWQLYTNPVHVHVGRQSLISGQISLGKT